LQHESRNDAVEGRFRISKAVFTSGEFTEVLRGLGDIFVEEFEDDTTCRLAVDGNIELKGRQV